MTLVIQPLFIPYNSLSAFVSVNAEPFRLINNLILHSAFSCNIQAFSISFVHYWSLQLLSLVKIE
jgi:hypothetical protein